MLVVILITLLFTTVYYLLKRNYEYWERKGVPGPKPHFIIGNLGKSVILKASPGHVFTDIYRQYEEEEFIGVYRATTPVLLIRDPEFIKEVTVKSFNHFMDNDFCIYKKDDPLFGRNIFTLKGDEWKMVRSQLTPTFTSGKMKILYPLLENSSVSLVKYIDSYLKTTTSEGYELKELTTRFTLNNIADTIFGIKSKCFDEENSEFRQLARDFFSSGSGSFIIFYLLTIFPTLSKYIPVRFITKKVESKLIKLVSETLEYREKNNISRNDFLHLVSQLKKTCKDYEFTDMDVAAHSAGFFFDGYETSSLVMTFALHELAANPETQKKLREEIDKAFEENDQSLPYDVLISLPYLDAVLNETMRLHPPLFLLQKLCTKEFTYTSKTGLKSLTIEKGTPILIPVGALHHDPKYFENPKTFNPDRFTADNKSQLTKYAFLPLGQGPRACIGQRYGILQIKIGIAYILRHYEISLNPKTKLPIKYLPTNILTSPISGLWVNFKKVR